MDEAKNITDLKLLTFDPFTYSATVAITVCVALGSKIESSLPFSSLSYENIHFELGFNLRN